MVAGYPVQDLIDIILYNQRKKKTEDDQRNDDRPQDDMFPLPEIFPDILFAKPFF